MSQLPFRYHFLDKEQLANELFELCLRLRRAQPADDDGSTSRRGRVARLRPGGADSTVRRCYIALKHSADFDFPRLLDADDRVRALLGTLNEAASLLNRFTEAERDAKHGRRNLPS